MTARSQALLRTEFSKAQQRADASDAQRPFRTPRHRAPVAQPAPPILDPAIGSAGGHHHHPEDRPVHGGGGGNRRCPAPDRSGPLPGHTAAGRDRQCGHRRASHHVPPSLLQPQRAGAGRPDHHRHAARDLPLPRDREPGRVTHRCVGGRPDPQADTHLDHLQSALQRQSTAGGARPSGGQHPGPPQARRHQRPDVGKSRPPSRRTTRRPHRRTIGRRPSCGGSRWPF